MDLYARLRDVADFPSPGIAFKDVTPLLADPAAFAESIARLVAPFRDAGVDVVAGIEARGFVFGSAAALALGCGFVPLRKPGKLPAAALGVDYALEYGSDRIEVHADAFAGRGRVLLVDDVLATGGTLAAAVRLVAQAGGKVVGGAVLVELDALGGRARWVVPAPLHAVLHIA